MQRLVNGEIRRHAGSRFSQLSCHEWILVAKRGQSGDGDGGDGGGGSGGGGGGPLEPLWVNVLTGQRCAEFPELGGLGPRDKIYRRGNGWTDKARGFKAEYGRDPLIWLDRACLDQNNLDADLACLPVFEASMCMHEKKATMSPRLCKR